MKSQNRRILIVDNEPEFLGLMTDSLKGEYEVYSAHDGINALEVLEKNDIKVILTDQCMPAMTGLQFLNEAKHVNPDTRAILFSGRTDFGTAVQSLNSGLVWKYLTKPIVFDDLLQLLNRAFEQTSADGGISKPGSGVIPSQNEWSYFRSAFEAFFNESLDAILAIDPGTRKIILANKSLERLMGYTSEDLIGRSFFSLLPESVRERHKALLDGTAIYDGVLNEQDFVRKDGSLWVADMSATLVEWNGDKTIVVNIRDVTARKRVEDKLQKTYESLEVAHKQLVVTHKSLVKNADVLRRKEKELRKAKQAADAANIAKSQFLANMSHEIRTPLNGILGYAQLLLEEPLTPRQKQFTATIRESGDHLLRIINDILDLSKIEAGRAKLQADPLCLDEVLNKQIQIIRPKIADRDVVLSYDFSPDLPDRYIGDASRIGQIVLNLLSNAAKFTASGEINVSVRGYPDERHNRSKWIIQIRVQDTGIGIPASKLEQIFESFRQVDNTAQRKYEGTGLGLAITRKLVQLMGGNITVDSHEEEGSTFIVTLPLKVFSGTYAGGQSEQPGSPVAGWHTVAQDKNLEARVLVVDDNEVNSELTRTILDLQGFQVTVVNDGKAAVETVQSGEFDVVLMDMQMPEMDGYETTRQIRAIPELTDIPIIALTAHTMVGDAEKCFEAGCNDYISKPIEKERFVQVVKSHVSGHRFTEADSETAESFSDELEALKKEYIGDLSGHPERLREAVENGDFESLKVTGHNLKGNGTAFGYPEISEIGAKIELAAAEEDRALIPELLNDLCQILERAQRELL